MTNTNLLGQVKKKMKGCDLWIPSQVTIVVLLEPDSGVKLIGENGKLNKAQAQQHL